MVTARRKVESVGEPRERCTYATYLASSKFFRTGRDAKAVAPWAEGGESRGKRSSAQNKGLGRGFNPRQERGRGGGGGIKIHTSGGENGKTIPLDQGGDGDEVMGEDGVRAYIAEDGSGVGGEMEVSSLFSKEGPPRREVKGHGWEVGRGEQAG